MGWMRDNGARLSRDLLAIPEVATVEQQIGRAESGEDPFPPNRSEMHVELKPGGAGGEDRAQAEIRKVLGRYPAIQSATLTFLGDRIPPDAFALSITGLGALVVNLGCALLLARVRHVHGSLTRAAFPSARNDTFANVGIIGAGLVTLGWSSVWPDIVVGLAIAWMNLDAAKEVWEAARSEGEELEPEP